MLAQNFMSSEDLGIEHDEHKALILLLGMLERAEIPHHRPDTPAAVTPTGFNMEAWRCGSVACLGGWAELLMGHGFKTEISENAPLDELFYPDEREEIPGITFESLKTITPEKAAQALRNFLTEGDANWLAVLNK